MNHLADVPAPVLLREPSLLRDRCYVGGEWLAADTGRTLTVKNPATGALIGCVPDMGQAETRRATDAAHAAQEAWKERTGKERAGILLPRRKRGRSAPGRNGQAFSAGGMS